MQVSATTFAQKVNVKVVNAPIKQVFYQLTKQTGFNFMADANLTKKIRPITFDLKNASMEEVLNKCFGGVDIDIVVNNEYKTVFIKETERKISAVKQVLIISGNVNDENNEPLPGVSIRLKNTQTSTVSDVNGKFTINVPNEEAILIFSFLGFATQEKKVGTSKVLNVRLLPKVSKLNEVVIIGYGATVAREDLTGAVGTPDLEDMRIAPVVAFDQALAGRIAGVQILSNDGQPGSEGINIAIRGQNSLTQDNSPLFVVDGFPMEDFDATSLSMDDIESIDVLKDASASAIYGARGANGVIVIQTKKGKIGEPVISYSATVGFQEITKRMELLSPYEFVKYQIERNPANIAKYTPADLAPSNSGYDANGNTLESYRNYRGIDWQDKLYRLGNTQIHNLAIRGGTQQTKYSISGSVYDQRGVILNTGLSRYQGRLSLDQQLTKKLNASLRVNFNRNNSFGQLASEDPISGQATSNLLFGAWGYRPVTGRETEGNDVDEDFIDDFRDEETTFIYDYRVNPIISAENTYRKSKVNNVNFNGNIDYKILKDLNLKVTLGFDKRQTNTENFYNSQTARGSSKLPNNTRGVQGNISIFDREIWTNSSILSYRKRFNKRNSLDALFGYELQGIDNSRIGLANEQIPNEFLGISGMDEGVTLPNTVTYSNSVLGSLISRVNYNYLSKYLFTATFRTDVSSKFAPGNRTAYFPSGAFAWRMGQEKFIKRSQFIYDAKLRVSYGTTGNNRVTDFAYLSPIIGTDVSESYSQNNGEPSRGMFPGSLGNKDLKWETTSQVDLGYDIAFLKNKVALTIDAYRKTTDNLLLNANVPYSFGYQRAFKNIGKIRNEGLEFSVNTTNIKNKNFDWRSSINISFNKNKILALSEDEQKMFSKISWATNYNATFLYAAEVGGPAAMFIGQVFDGVYQYADFEEVSPGKYYLKPGIPYTGTDRDAIKPGDIKYKDLNGDGVINEYDITIIGNPQPKHSGGFVNNFKYKNFGLNVFFQWVYGNDVFNGNRIYFEGNPSNVPNLNQYASYADRWTPENQSNTMFRSGGYGPAYYSSRVIEDGSFLRLKTVSLSYEVPKKILSKVKISNMNLSLVAQNLYTWTKYSGMDPEVSARHSTLTPGFDFSAYPRARTIAFSLRTTF
ncbi:SusC/RagA family TonB-linked outer membrane protein [Pseudopedobacter beijingensis]|uniref:SusC/RagA family TonB-linked outer membrane protein n=1 Tax=Pseudopedobacter beijingensis TaxID=1207056 RepID=A0ABW4I7W2_9SPHI